MGLISYIKKRKRNAVLAILAFIPFKALVHSLFWSLDYSHAIAWSGRSAYLFPKGDFDVQIWGWDNIKKESIIDIEWGYGYEDLNPWILSIILFTLIIYAFHDGIKAQ